MSLRQNLLIKSHILAKGITSSGTGSHYIEFNKVGFQRLTEVFQFVHRYVALVFSLNLICFSNIIMLNISSMSFKRVCGKSRSVFDEIVQLL